LIAHRSSILVTDCCKFLDGKTTGRSVSEPICSPVNAKTVDVDPVPKWGRPKFTGFENGNQSVEFTGVTGMACGGRQTVQCWRSYTETGKSQLICIRKRKHIGLYRKSEGFIVPFEEQGQHNPLRGKEPCFVNASEIVEVLSDCRDANNTINKEQETIEEAMLYSQAEVER